MERYERESKLSIYWFNRANDLRGAAGAVWFAIEAEPDGIRDFLEMEAGYSFAIATPPVFRMLCGLSLELLYKATILKAGERPPESHQLRLLASEAKVVLDANDHEDDVTSPTRPNPFRSTPRGLTRQLIIRGSVKEPGRNLPMKTLGTLTLIGAVAEAGYSGGSSSPTEPGNGVGGTVAVT